jgi:hypothetical protein
MFAGQIFYRDKAAFYLSGHVDQKKNSEFGEDIIRMQRMTLVLYYILL